jgi:hypothetical protein
MFDAIIHWINTIPLQDPLRAFAIIGIMFAFSALLNGLWEVFFNIAGWFRSLQRQARQPAEKPVTEQGG